MEDLQRKSHLWNSNGPPAQHGESLMRKLKMNKEWPKVMIEHPSAGPAPCWGSTMNRPRGTVSRLPDSGHPSRSAEWSVYSCIVRTCWTVQMAQLRW